MHETLLREALAARGSEMDRDERRTNPFGHVRVLDVYAVFLHDPEDRLKFRPFSLNGLDSKRRRYAQRA